MLLFVATPPAQELSQHLPESPPLYDPDTMSDRPMRFFASEIIREKVFTCMGQEVRTAFVWLGEQSRCQCDSSSMHHTGPQ
jgi:hypothetical protein